MSTSIVLVQARLITGVVYAAGETVVVDDELADYLVTQGLATRTTGVPSGWMDVPSLFRLRLSGTGTCTVDSRDHLGTVTYGVANYTVTSAINRIEFPYAGDSAVEIRLRLTGSCKAEVIK